MPLPLVALLLPALFWDRPVNTADTLRKAGIEHLYVSAGQVQAWRNLGFEAKEFDRAGATKATPPAVEYRMDVASATHVPWVDANGWRFERNPAGTYFYDAPKSAAALAAAEAFAYGVDAAVRVTPGDLDAFARMSRFLTGIRRPPLPVRANIAVVDDGSEPLGEVLNLMARHNLLFQVVQHADPKYNLNIKLGTPDYPAEDVADPYEFAMKVRRRLTDERRLLRIYGSNVVLAHLTGDSTGTRVHLLNYGGAVVRGLRIRVLGSYQQGKVAVFDHSKAALEDYTVQDGATEFTISEMGPYAVVDLVP